MKILFFVSLFFILYPYIGYPIILGLLSLVFGGKIKRDFLYPYVSLIISAYNEEKTIQDKIKNSLELDYPKEKLEIIIASESSDGTNEIAKKFSSQGVVLYTFSGHQGKAATLYRVVPLAKGEIIVFSDANAIYEKDAIKKIVSNFSDNTVGCVSGQLKYINPTNSHIGKSEIFYWRYEMIIKRLESKLFSLLGANGSFFAIRKNLYFPMSQDRGDDFELPVRVILNNYKVILDNEAISWEISSTTTQKEFKRKVRIISWNIKSVFLLLEESLKQKRILLTFQLISQRILRWLVFIFLICFFISNLFLPQPLFRIVLISQILFFTIALLGYLLDINGKHIPNLLNLPYYFCLVYLASLFGVYKYLGNKTSIVWEKVRQ